MTPLCLSYFPPLLQGASEPQPHQIAEEQAPRLASCSLLCLPLLISFFHLGPWLWHPACPGSLSVSRWGTAPWGRPACSSATPATSSPRYARAPASLPSSIRGAAHLLPREIHSARFGAHLLGRFFSPPRTDLAVLW